MYFRTHKYGNECAKQLFQLRSCFIFKQNIVEFRKLNIFFVHFAPPNQDKSRHTIASAGNYTFSVAYAYNIEHSKPNKFHHQCCGSIVQHLNASVRLILWCDWWFHQTGTEASLAAISSTNENVENQFTFAVLGLIFRGEPWFMRIFYTLLFQFKLMKGACALPTNLCSRKIRITNIIDIYRQNSRLR